MSSGTNRKLKVGLIGCGRVAQFVHLPILARLATVDLVAVAEADAGRLDSAARVAPGARTFADYRDLLAAADVDAVVICLPTAMHADAARAAFAAGKHVYVEKPLASTDADADAVVAAWRASGRFGMVGFNYRFHPLHVELRRRVAAGAVGTVTAVRSSFCTAARDLPAWKRDRATGGGVLLDLLSHHADLARFLFDRDVSAVRATARSLRSDDDTAAVELRLADGLVVQTTASMAAVEEDRWEVYGDDGKLTLDRHAGTLEWAPPRRGSDFPARVFRVADLACAGAATAARTLLAGGEPSYGPALRHFADSVLAGRAPSPDLADGRKSLAVVSAAGRAARSGAVEPVAGAPPVVDREVARESAIDLTPEIAKIDDPARPAMSVVLVTVDAFRSLRKVVNCYRRQTVHDRLELILIAPTEQALADATGADLAGFFAVQKLAVGPIDNIDKITVTGVRAARAAVVALVEDHAYPDPTYCEHLLDAHRSGPWAAVGPAIWNANPATCLSWANMLLSYGQWTEPVRRGETQSIARHNVTYKAAALLTYGDRLEDKFGRDGNLMPDLIGRGYRFFLEPRARTHHVNPSRWASTIELRIGAGRLYGAARAARERWSPLKRAAYAVGSPLIPLIRFRRLREDLFVAERRRLVGNVKANLALTVGVVLDGVGQMLGYALGPGTTGQSLAYFEMHRVRHLTRQDRAVMAE